MKRYEAVIIGFGKGGKTLAAALAKQGYHVAVVERSKLMYGGTCINIGCIPTKALVHLSKNSQLLGLKDFAEKEEFYAQAIDQKSGLIEALRQKNYDNLASKETVTVYTGVASFINSHEVSVETEEGVHKLYGERIFINTGAAPIIPDIEGVRSSKYVYTSTELMDQAKLPKRLLIIGGGYIGLEFASMYAGFGAEVTVLDAHGGLLPREDKDIAEEVLQVLEKKGIRFRLNANVKSIQDRDGFAVVTAAGKENEEFELEGEAVLLAAGRRPSTGELRLENAGVSVAEGGAVLVDEHLQTSVPHIYALGDVKGGLQFTYISLDDYRIVLDHLAGSKQRTAKERKNVPFSVFIDPPLSRIGLTEQEAIREGYEIKTSKLPVPAISRARLMNETEGVLKAVIDAKTGKILGCTLFCADSHEVINTVRMAMELGQSYTFLRDFIFTHPTMSEALNDLFQI